MAFTYAQLKTVIQDYTENTETSFVTNLPVFIRAAEDRIFKLVDLEVFRKNATSALTQNDRTCQCRLTILHPSRCRSQTVVRRSSCSRRT